MQGAAAADRRPVIRRRLGAAGIVLLCLAVCVPLIGHLNRVDDGYEALRQTGAPAAGRVLDRHAFSKITWWSIEYEHDGAVYRGSVECAASCFEEGAALTVYVDRADPTRFLTDSGKNSVSSANYLFGVVVFGVMVGLLAAAYLVRSLIVDRADSDQPPTRFFQGRDIAWQTYVPRLLGATALLVGAVFVQSWWLAGAGLAVILASGIVERRRRARARDGQ